MPEPWESDPVVALATAQQALSPSAAQPWDTDPVVPMDAGAAVSPLARQRGNPWHSFVTGAGRTEFPNAPELGTSGPSVPAFSAKGQRMAGAYLTSVESDQIADIAVKTLPGDRQDQANADAEPEQPRLRQKTPRVQGHGDVDVPRGRQGRPGS